MEDGEGGREGKFRWGKEVWPDRLGCLGTSVIAPPRDLWPPKYKQLLAQD